MKLPNQRLVRGESIHGVDVDQRMRCAHFHTALDIIAIKFKCCGDWFPCYECHAAVADHDSNVWLAAESGEKAILCGNCEYRLSIREYFDCNSGCPECEAEFNPGCANHYHLYFETENF